MVMRRLVSVALGSTKRASSLGTPDSTSLWYVSLAFYTNSSNVSESSMVGGVTTRSLSFFTVMYLWLC